MQILRYKGDGSFLLDVPARDISLGEAQELGLDLKELEASGLYALETEPEPEPEHQEVKSKVEGKAKVEEKVEVKESEHSEPAPQG